MPATSGWWTEAAAEGTRGSSRRSRRDRVDQDQLLRYCDCRWTEGVIIVVQDVISKEKRLPSDSRELSARSSRLVHGSRIFYGWIILAVGTLGMIMTSPAQTFVVSVFTEHLMDDLQLSRSVVSSLYSGGTLLAGLLLPIIGRQIDRRGPRIMVGLITAVFGLACIYMGFVQGVLMLSLGFFAIRLLGQGSLDLVSSNVINQWWVRRRGTVNGVSGIAMSLLGMGAFPNLVNWLIATFGWRLAYISLGTLLLVVMLPLGIVFFRNRPEDYGLLPDGREAPTVNDRVGVQLGPEDNWTTQEALRTRAFWIPALDVALSSMMLTGLFFHMVGIFGDQGLTSTMAAAAMAPVALSAALVNLGGGALADRVPVRFLLATALALQALCLVMAQFLASTGMASIYGVVLGTATGLFSMAARIIWAQYFGRLHLASIAGVASTLGVLGAALGPMPLGIARDLAGSYNPVLTVSAILSVLMGAAVLTARKPRARTGAQAHSA